MSEPAFQVRIRADKTGPQPAPGQPWPALGLEIVGDPPETVSLPASFVRRNAAAGFLRVEGAQVVRRPSRPNPAVENGSAAVADEHELYDGAQPFPHAFEHLDRIIFNTLNHGEVAYDVVRQPDKYATDVDGEVVDDEAKVTPELYAAGRTRVDHFYVCSLVSIGQEA